MWAAKNGDIDVVKDIVESQVIRSMCVWVCMYLFMLHIYQKYVCRSFVSVLEYFQWMSQVSPKATHAHRNESDEIAFLKCYIAM